ncbi:ferredoxin-NADP reductase [Mumia flava]|uniref:Ferredoxin-NADP reductase n=1 Tax=Mumia flava TaxID=1348852 RepID=A0A0B2BHP2_9ACTN|nr:ferredoxin reductase [Mumia flava]PJJ54230.1 ferredoxin-NADP reductase [Mumia flava]
MATWRRATCVSRTAETASAVTLELDVEGWPGNLAGQHVDLRLTADDGYTATRSYSLSSPAAAPSTQGGRRRVAVTVQRVADGEVSPYLADDFAVSDEIEVRGPIGEWFVWEPDGTPVTLIAGGSGIVPLVSMVRTRREARSRTPFRLLYSVRTPADRMFRRELAHPGPDDQALDVAFLYTREAPEEAARPVGRIEVADLVSWAWPPDFAPATFVCGPTGFVESVAAMLISLGHDPARIKTERFGPTGV